MTDFVTKKFLDTEFCVVTIQNNDGQNHDFNFY